MTAFINNFKLNTIYRSSNGDKPCEINLAVSAGFCAGVAKAVATAEEMLREGIASSLPTPFYMYGELIHNNFVIEHFTSNGVKVVDSISDIPKGAKTLIRAHGIPPQEEKTILDANIKMTDCTCGYVRRIHTIVRQAYLEGKQILITGAPHHPEIIGINGECDNTAVILTSTEDAENLDCQNFKQKSAILVSQTTFSCEIHQKIREILKNKIAKLEFFGTICLATEKRQAEAAFLATYSDIMIVIGSKKSSNTMKLFDVCRNACGDTYLVEKPDDVCELMCKHSLAGQKVGVTAGASSPESIIMEVIQRMIENEVVQNQAEQSDVSFTDFIENIPELKRGVTVKGVITSYDDENVYVDVKDKSEGRIPRREFDNDPEFDLEKAKQEHTEIEVYVRSIRNSDMGKDIQLSKARVDFSKYKNLIEEAYKNKTPITVKVVSVVKDGVIATFGSVDIYIHRTQLEMGTVDNLEDYKGKTIEILVTQFDPEKKRMRVAGSRRVLLNRERAAKAAEVWNTLAVGDIREGVVRSLTDFGAFVDIGGVDGLVHVSELSWNRIKHPSEVIKVGDHIQVYVKEFDPERKRISLGYKRIEDDPYHDIETRFPIGTIVHGKVVRMFPFGAFVEIADGVDALCHISQISTARLAKPSEVLKEGMEVDARVMEVSNEQRRISISIKEVAPIDPIDVAEKKEEPAEELPTEHIDKSDAEK